MANNDNNKKLNLKKTTLKNMKIKTSVQAGSTCASGETEFTINKGLCVLDREY
jgi:hypothetical protein